MHYWQLPNNLYISLNSDFHKKLCSVIQKKVGYPYKNCFHKVLNCPKWHAQRLFTRFIRFRLNEFEILRKFAEISREEVEINIETIGNHEDGTIIQNPKLPFHMKDLFYVASHLMFDGSFRFKHGCYFYSYEDSLTNYHKERMNSFGNVPTNLVKKENQLYFSYTIGYIAAKVLDIKTFKSKTCQLSEKFKLLAKEHKTLTDEVIKALIIDEGSIEDKIKIELANKKLVKDLSEIIREHYNLTKPISRQRYNISFKGLWNHNLSVWGINFSAKSFEELCKSISPLPIDYKQEALEFLSRLQNKNYIHRKHGETKKLITASLLKSPKTFFELSRELHIRQTTISAHIRKLPFIKKVGEKILRRGGFTRVSIHGIKNIPEAQKFLETKTHYKRNYKKNC